MSARIGTTRAITVYLVGFTLTNVGVGGFTLAVGLALYQETGSAAAFGLLVAVEYGLGFVGQVCGGSVLDRYRTLDVAVLTNSVRLVAVLFGGVLLWAAETAIPLTVAFLVSAFIRPQYRSASFVLSREVASGSDLARINALRSGFLPAAKLIGLATVAGLAAVAPIGAVLCLLTAFFGAGTWAYWRLLAVPGCRVTQKDHERREDRPGTAKESWAQLAATLRAAPGLQVQFFLYGMPATVVALAAVLVAPVNESVGGGSFGIAALEGGAATGALCSIALLRRIRQSGDLVGVACVLVIVALTILATGRSIGTAAFSFWLLGLASTLAATSLDTVLQTRASSAILGRLFITQEAAISITAIVLLPASGQLASGHGISATSAVYAGVAAGYLAVFLIARLLLRDRLFNEPVELKKWESKSR